MPRMLARAGILVALLAPTLVLAGATDVTLTTDTILSVNGITINVSGSSATVESITVNATDFSFVLQSGSSIQVTAPNLNKLTADSSVDNITDTCNASQSLIKYVGTSAHTITITPSATICVDSGGGGGGGGGGGARATPAIPATQIEGCAPGNLFNTMTGKSCTVRATPATPATPASAASSFARNLRMGTTGADVQTLQKFLNARGYSVSLSGPGSPGNETTTFGALTRAAVVKYQQAKGIKPAVGFFGPLTRAAASSEQ